MSSGSARATKWCPVSNIYIIYFLSLFPSGGHRKPLEFAERSVFVMLTRPPPHTHTYILHCRPLENFKMGAAHQKTLAHDKKVRVLGLPHLWRLSIIMWPMIWLCRTTKSSILWLIYGMLFKVLYAGNLVLIYSMRVEKRWASQEVMMLWGTTSQGATCLSSDWISYLDSRFL